MHIYKYINALYDYISCVDELWQSAILVTW